MISPALRLRLQLWILQLKQATRAAYDLLPFGSGTGERIIGSLVLGAFFFLTCLVIAHLQGYERKSGIVLAGSSFGIVFLPSVLLLVGASDAELKRKASEIRYRISRLPPPLPRQPKPAVPKSEESVLAIAGAQTPPTEPPKDLAPSPPPQVLVEPLSKPLTRECPFCRERILEAAMKCKHCGEFLVGGFRRESTRVHPKWSAGAATLLSLIFPGLGQIYKGSVLSGFLWCICTLIGYLMCLLPGMMLHLVCLLDAASGDPYE